MMLPKKSDKFTIIENEAGELALQYSSYNVNIARFSRGSRADAFQILAKLNAHDELVTALSELLGPKPQEDWSCHKGITTMAKCGNCSRINAGYAALAKARGEA